MENKIFLIILLLAYCTLVECMFPLIKKTYDIEKFFLTKSFIWTYNTTRGGARTCQVDKVTHMNDTTIMFKRYFYNILRRKTFIPLEGTIYFDKKNLMIVRAPGYKYKEKLVFYDPHFKCAVIKITTPFTGGVVTYDLRVWNAYAKLGPAFDCVKKFSNKEPHGRVIYTPKCHDILEGMQLSQLPQLPQEKVNGQRG
uniref:Putative group i salivary lipocalin n=1 Tax=Rhipicephalus pulchellus TaxID=72859 RepID=L7LQI7_RHIPC